MDYFYNKFSDSKSLQFSIILSNVIVWIVSVFRWISVCAQIFARKFWIVRGAIMIGVTIIFTLHHCFSILTTFWYLSSFSKPFNSTLHFDGAATSTIWYIFLYDVSLLWIR